MIDDQFEFTKTKTIAVVECFMQEKFKKIMELDGIKDEQITESLSFKENKNQLFKAGQGAGKSGSFFFFSSDRKFVIKTISNKEKNVLLSLLDDLISHYEETDNQSLIARIYGVCKVKSKSFAQFYIVIM